VVVIRHQGDGRTLVCGDDLRVIPCYEWCAAGGEGQTDRRVCREWPAA
jgi:hypothetical protein